MEPASAKPVLMNYNRLSKNHRVIGNAVPNWHPLKTDNLWITITILGTLRVTGTEARDIRNVLTGIGNIRSGYQEQPISTSY
jgi:hypothetical protein